MKFSAVTALFDRLVESSWCQLTVWVNTVDQLQLFLAELAIGHRLNVIVYRRRRGCGSHAQAIRLG